MFYKILDEETKRVQVGQGTDKEFFESVGMKECSSNEVEKAFNGVWYLKGFAPKWTNEQANAEARYRRSRLYRAESDGLFMKYQEAVARGATNVEELKQIWLASKDSIRAQHPYIEEDK